jgi:sugar phosphate isomerase/epimerase
MKLSVSCRIAEGFRSKEESILSLSELCDLAVQAGYEAICMRASQIGVHSPPDRVAAARETIRARNLGVSMVTGDFDIVYNNQRGPNCLTHITPYLNLAEALDAPLVRVCIKHDSDIASACRAADEAAERGITLVHQCHVQSLFETVDQIEKRLRQIDRPNFGLIFEAANLEECRQDYGPATIARLAPWIQNVYLQNQRLNPSGAVTLDTWTHGPICFDVIDIPDAGGIDFSIVFDGLKQAGYDGIITVHQSAPEDGSSPTVAATKTATFLRERMRST